MPNSNETFRVRFEADADSLKNNLKDIKAESTRAADALGDKPNGIGSAASKAMPGLDGVAKSAAVSAGKMKEGQAASNGMAGALEKMGGTGNAVADRLVNVAKSIVASGASLMNVAGAAAGAVITGIVAVMGIAKKSMLEMINARRAMAEINSTFASSAMDVFAKLDEINQKEALTNEEREKALHLVEILKTRYHELSLSVDESTGKVKGMVAAQRALYLEKRKNEMAVIDAEYDAKAAELKSVWYDGGVSRWDNFQNWLTLGDSKANYDRIQAELNAIAQKRQQKQFELDANDPTVGVIGRLLDQYKELKAISTLGLSSEVLVNEGISPDAIQAYEEQMRKLRRAEIMIDEKEINEVLENPLTNNGINKAALTNRLEEAVNAASEAIKILDDAVANIDLSAKAAMDDIDEIMKTGKIEAPGIVIPKTLDNGKAERLLDDINNNIKRGGFVYYNNR